MKKIDVDDEIYALLERNVRGFETPNDVLRRLLLEGTHDQVPGGSHPAERDRGRVGKLKALLDQEKLAAGDQLVHRRPRKGDTLTGFVCDDGGIETDQGWFESPSPALGGLTGSQIDGWANWTHQRSGKTLRTLRSELQ